MPENSYFREPPTQTMLLEILFVYCKLNRDIGYRQGMHEVLAPILWVISCDAIIPEGHNETQNAADGLMLQSLDQKYIEHDAFTLFGAIMQTVKTFYELGSNKEPSISGMSNDSPIVERSKRIHENYLHHADPELAEHLTAIEILPQIFLIRWVRLLFGREFPFEDVLALWDILFAEDPALELIDLISVSMLLRIRWQRKYSKSSRYILANCLIVLEADYSAALTLLLRYPVPLPPHGPPTFVSDALYLRHNLLLDGGDHIISKYSRKAPETTVTRKLPKKVKRARTAEQAAAQKAMVPHMSPARFIQKNIQEQGGFEGMIQEAAKGVYSRGEKWGVTKALRGAVQNLQSNNASPRGSLDRSRWSLDSGNLVTESPAALMSKIQALESRNKNLAKMLEKAMEELWIQRKQKQEASLQDNNKPMVSSDDDALSLAIAKVQFVQVYLENSTMPLPPSETPEPDQSTPTPITANSLPTSPRTKRPPSPPIPTSDGTIDTILPSHPPKSTLVPPSTVPRTHSSPSSLQAPSTPQQPGVQRPSLSQTPFSWMLGEEQKKSGFVAVSPFSSPRRGRDRERGGSLFGNEEAGLGRGRARAGSQLGVGLGIGDNGGKGEADGDVFTVERRR